MDQENSQITDLNISDIAELFDLFAMFDYQDRQKENILDKNSSSEEGTDKKQIR